MNTYTYLSQGQMREQRQSRDAAIRVLRKRGWTLEKIASKFRMTKQRVGQICKPNGKGTGK